MVERRIGLLFAIFLCLLALAGGRTLWLGGVKAPSLKRAAVTQQVNEIKVPARRGSITDRRGIDLAVSEPASDVAATPYLVTSPLRAAALLAPLLGSTEADVLKKLSSKSGFVYLARNLSASKVQKIKALKIVGLDFTPSSRREYPRRWLASQVIGGVGVDGDGLSGLEYAQDDVLGGSDGTRRVVNDGVGDPIVQQEPKRAVAGKDLRLTIDAPLQAKVEDVLAEIGAKWHPKGATAIVMDPRNGGVLTMANWPRVDANDFGGAPQYAAQNRAVGFNYEPGSTFKPFTVSGALEEGVVDPDDVFNLPPTIEVADRTIGESHERGTIDLTTSEILAQSSNVGTVKIGLKLGATRFDRWVRRFGFGQRTGIELAGEEAGQVLARKDYSGSSIGNLPIGQGASVTPLQLTRAYAAIANGGMLRKPQLIAAVDGKRSAQAPGQRVLSAKTAKQVRSMLEGVVSVDGTGSAAAIDGYTLAGKTGTANKIDRKTGEYSKSRYIGSFVGFAPAAKPKLLVTVMVDEPQGEIYGAEVAAPAFQEIMRFALPYLSIPPG